MKEIEANFSVLTLNIWGLPFAKDRAFRMHSIGQKLSSLSLDVIGLQEAWMEEDRRILSTYLARSGVRFSYYFRSGLLGSGLYILSRFPIIAVDFHPYFLNGNPENLLDGEYLSRKGIGLARIKSPHGFIDVYNTQPVAQYAPDIDDVYHVHRTAAMYDAARFINARSPANPVIAFGDFNVRPDQFEYQVITKVAGLTDCYPTLYTDDLGETISPQNPYQPKEFPKRIDYIFVRDSQEVQVQPVAGGTVLKKIPGAGKYHNPIFYSDHYGVQMNLSLNGSFNQSAARKYERSSANHEPGETDEVLADLRAIFEKAAITTADQGRLHLIKALVGLFLAFFLILMVEKAQKSRVLLVPRWVFILYAAFEAWLGLIVAHREKKFLASLNEDVHILIHQSINH